MLALREFFWNPWPARECGEVTTVIADFTVSAPSNVSSPDDVGLPVCSRVIVVSS